MLNKLEKFSSDLLEVAVITRNRQKSLTRLLGSFIGQTILPHRIIVIDNASNDQTEDVVKEFSKLLPIKYTKEKRIGIPHARNRALHEARGDIIAFIDDDCEAYPGWVEEILKAHKKFPDAVAVQGKVKNYPEQGVFSTIVETVYGYWVLKNTYKGIFLKVLDTKNVSFKTKIVKRKDLNFDNNFHRGSDVDFANQLLSKNLTIILSEKIIVRHWERSNILAFLKQRISAGKTQAALETKWPSSLPAFEKSRTRYLSHIEKMGRKLPFSKRLIVKVLFKFYGPLFKLSFEKQKVNYSLLKLSPVYKKVGSISVGVITKNRPVLLKNALFSLFKQTIKPSEVLIIDGSSNNDSKKVALKFSEKLNINYIVQKKAGISNARNLVLQNARENIVGFVDDDCEVEATWVESMLFAHRKFPEASIIQGCCEVKPYSGLTSRIYQEDYNNWILHSLKNKNELLRADIENSSVKVNKLRKKKIYFDEEKKFYYSDDVDLSYQVVYQGGKIIYFPKALMRTARRGLMSLLIQRVKKGYSAALTDMKWGEVHNSQLLILKGKVVFVAGDQVKSLAKSFFKGLPSYSFFKLIFYPVFSSLYKMIFKLSYSFTRSQADFSVSRLHKNYLPLDHKKAKKISVSVMVITRDRPEGLRRLLHSIAKQSVLPKEIIIVDSSKRKIGYILDEFSDMLFKYIYEERKGYSFARNRALQACKSEIIATTDDDAVVPEDWIKSICLAHMAYPKAVAIQGKIVSLPERSIISIVEQLHMDKWFLRNLESDGRFNTLSTKNASFKIQELRKKGLKFNEMELFNVFGGEDVDMANQIISKSAEIRYSASIYIYHYERVTFINYFRQRIRKGGSSALVSFYWAYLPYRQFYSLAPKFFESLLIPIKFLSFRKVFLHYFLISFIYYIAEIAFLSGRKKVEKKLENFLSPDLSLKQMYRNRYLPDVSVGVILESRQSIKHVVEALLRQTLKPKRMYFYIEQNDKRNEKILKQIKKITEVVILKSGKSKLAKINDLIERYSKKEVLCVLSSRNIPTDSWVENLVRAHKKNGISIIQGQTIYKPDYSKVNLISQFIWQTLLRNSIISGKQSYWNWVNNNPKAYGLNIIDINNFSVRITKDKSVWVGFRQDLLEMSAAIIFASKQRDLNQAVTMEATAKTNIFSHPSAADYIEKGYQDSKVLDIQSLLLRDQKYLVSLNFIKRILAFNYFLYKRNIFWQMPILNFIYFLYLGSYYFGVLKYYLSNTKTTRKLVAKKII